MVALKEKQYLYKKHHSGMHFDYILSGLKISDYNHAANTALKSIVESPHHFYEDLSRELYIIMRIYKTYNKYQEENLSVHEGAIPWLLEK